MDGPAKSRTPNHQLIGGKHPNNHRVSSILLVMQDFAGPSTVSHSIPRTFPLLDSHHFFAVETTVFFAAFFSLDPRTLVRNPQWERRLLMGFIPSISPFVSYSHGIPIIFPIAIWNSPWIFASSFPLQTKKKPETSCSAKLLAGSLFTMVYLLERHEDRCTAFTESWFG